MPIPLATVAILFVWTFLTKVPLAWAMIQEPEGYDNRDPRGQQARLTGWGKRALAAHKNSLEAFAPFGVAVLMAALLEADPFYTAVLAITFLVARLLYFVCYLADWPYLRSTLWFVGILSNGGIYLLALWKFSGA